MTVYEQSFFLKKILYSCCCCCFLIIVLFCFNYNTAWRNVFKWVLPNGFMDSQSGEGPNKKVTATSQLEQRLGSWADRNLTNFLAALYTSVYWLENQNLHCQCSSAEAYQCFRIPSPIPLYELTYNDLNLNWISLSLNSCQILVFIWPMNSQLRW